MNFYPQILKPLYYFWGWMPEFIEFADGHNDLFWRNIGKKFGAELLVDEPW